MTTKGKISNVRNAGSLVIVYVEPNNKPDYPMPVYMGSRMFNNMCEGMSIGRVKDLVGREVEITNDGKNIKFIN